MQGNRENETWIFHGSLVRQKIVLSPIASVSLHSWCSEVLRRSKNDSSPEGISYRQSRHAMFRWSSKLTDPEMETT